MEPKFWHERWELNEIGFHQPQVHPLLAEHWHQLGIPKGQVFVPLCGKTLDLLWLRQQGHAVLGVELSPLAVGNFFTEQSLPSSTYSMEELQVSESDGIKIVCGDIFDLKPNHLTQVEAVYDRAALIALPKDLQARYARHLMESMPHRPPILLITLEYDQTEMDGPPFSTSEQRVRELFAGEYQIETLATQEILDEIPGLKSKGLTRLTEIAYRLSN